MDVDWAAIILIKRQPIIVWPSAFTPSAKGLNRWRANTANRCQIKAMNELSVFHPSDPCHPCANSITTGMLRFAACRCINASKRVYDGQIE